MGNNIKDKDMKFELRKNKKKIIIINIKTK